MAYRFDDVEVDGREFRVTKAGVAVRLEPKALEFLLFLIERPGRLVTKAEIQDAVWKDTAVTENALTRLVAQIRKALGDDAREARYIETVPTRGYRFVAPVTEAAEPGPNGGGRGPSDWGAGRRPPRWSPGRRAAVGIAGALAIAIAIAGVRAWATRDRAAVAAANVASRERVQRQMSTKAGLNVFPRFSPDGSTLAYATLRDGSMEIVARALASGASEVAVTSDGMQNVQPAYSPDGRLLAYHSVVRGGIWVVPALGGLPRQLVPWGSRPCWSPDGSRIVFQSQAWFGSNAWDWAAVDGSTLWVVSAEGGPPHPLTSLGAAAPGGHGSPDWSPDGTRIAFVAGRQVYSIRVDGAELRRLSEDVWVSEVMWERSGRSQIWVGVKQVNWFVWRVPVDPATGARAGAPRVLASGGDTASSWRHLALSPDGRSLAYAALRTRSEILVQPVDASGAPSGGAVPLVQGIDGRKLFPAFAPDGRRLAFVVPRPGGGTSLWIADLATGQVRLAAERESLIVVNAWFPDSRRVGALVREGSGVGLWTLDVDTGEQVRQRGVEPTRLTAQSPLKPVLSHDGATLAAHFAEGGVLNVWTAGWAGGPFRRVTHDREGIGYPVWSPDGTSLAVEIMRHGATHIGIIPATGGDPRMLTTADGQSWPHSFSPDGRRVAFAGQRGGVWNLYWVSASGGPEHRVTAYSSPASYVRYPDWSPRGDRIAYEHAETTAAVWITDLPETDPPR